MRYQFFWKRKTNYFAWLIAAACVFGSTNHSLGQDEDDNIVIPEGADGVTINNPERGAIIAERNAIITSADTTIRNRGLIEGGLNGVNFVNGLGSGILRNEVTGRIESNSRAVNIGGPVQLTNRGLILGTGNQRNGTVYSDSAANQFLIDNQGTIDAGRGNQGAGVALEIGTRTTAEIFNTGDIFGRTNQAGVAGNSGLSGDGLRLGNFTPLGPGQTRTFDGLILNSTTGSISSESLSGPIAGVRVGDGIGFQGLLKNAGSISGARNGLYFGNGDHSGGIAQNSGLLQSGSRALNIDGTGLEIDNTGRIVGTGNQRNGTVYADSTAQDFQLDNSGLIDAGAGNQGAGFSAELSEAGNQFSILNSGQLLGRGNALAGSATAGDGIRLERTRVGGALDASTTGRFTGSIDNEGTIRSEGANGTVSGFRTVNRVDFQGILNNSGTIAGTQNGVYFGNGNHSSGSLQNSGLIQSDSRALNIDGTGLSVNNSGRILGTGNQRNGTVYADSTAQDFALNNSGTIDAGIGNQGAGFSVELSETGNQFSLSNSGQLLGRGNALAGSATAGDGIRLERTRVGGQLDGSTTGLFTGSIDNQGTISSEGANGTVSGFRTVDRVDFQGVLRNSGSIAGTQNGVYFGNGDHRGGVLNNQGAIQSSSRALNIDGVGLVVNNSGAIRGAGNQRNGTVYADSTAQNFTLNNNGLIDAGAGNQGAGFSVELSQAGNDFTINNNGQLLGRGNASAGLAIAGDGIRLERTRVGGALDGSTSGLFTGTINNNGSLTTEGNNGTVGAFRAVNGVNFQGALNNNGTIAGPRNGVYFGTGDHTGGVVNNFGTISSDSRAVNIDGNGLTLNNSGTIAATGRQRNGTVYVDGTADNFTVRNSGDIDARTGAGSAISVQVGSFRQDVQRGSIINSGLVAGSGDSELDAGVRLFTNAHEASFEGNIVNQAGGTILGGDLSAAVLVEADTQFDGTFINNGTVDGSVFLNDGDLQLGSSSVLSLEIGGLNDFESVETLGDITFDGILDIAFVDGFAPIVGQSFDLFDFGFSTGEFDQIRADGVQFDTSDLNIGGSLSVASVPEPGAVSLLCLGSTLLLARRRRRRA